MDPWLNCYKHPGVLIQFFMGFRIHAGEPQIHDPQSQSGIYIDTGLGSAANTVIPADAGIQGIVQNVLSWTPAYAGVTKDFAFSVCAN